MVVRRVVIGGLVSSVADRHGEWHRIGIGMIMSHDQSYLVVV